MRSRATAWMLAGATLLVLCQPARAAAEPPRLPGADHPVASCLDCELVCRATILDDGATVLSGHGAIADVVQSAEVSAVCRGDPDARLVKIHAPRDREWAIRRGRRLLLFLQGPLQFARAVKALPDTAANRKALTDALGKWRRKQRELNFTDMEAFLAEAEEFLRAYLGALARRFPGHPHLDAQALRAARVRTCPDPPGIHVRIDGGLATVETWHGPRRLPQGEGFILWLGLSTDRHFRVGSPYHERLGSAPHVRQGRMPGKWLTLNHFLAVPAGKDGFARAAEGLLRAWRPRFDALNADPPQDVAAALDCILSHWGRKHWQEDARLLGGALVAARRAEMTGMGSRLAAAFHALDRDASVARLSREQKARLVPALIDLLTDRTIVSDQTPCDGPTLACHHVAHDLLVRLTGQKLPPAVKEGRYAPQRPVARPKRPSQTPDPAREAAAVRERLAAWRAWWDEVGRKPLED